jgi:hypothetical protein
VIPQWLLQIRTFNCSILITKTFNTLFEFIIFLCIPSTHRTLRNVLKNNPRYILYRWQKCNLYILIICLTVKLRFMTEVLGKLFQCVSSMTQLTLMIGRKCSLSILRCRKI